MPWNLLLLPLLAGYCALHICHFFRFRAQKQDGNRLLFESALAGIPLLILGRLTTYWFAFLPWGKMAEKGLVAIIRRAVHRDVHCIDIVRDRFAPRRQRLYQ